MIGQSHNGYTTVKLTIADPAVAMTHFRSQDGYMTEQAPNHIRRYREFNGWSQAELAERIGAHWITVSKLERGKIKLSDAWMEKISKAFNIGRYDLLIGANFSRKFILDGAISSDGSFREYPKADQAAMIDLDFEISFSPSERIVWVTMESDLLYPFIHSGDVVRFTFDPLSGAPNQVGRLCLLSDGDGSGSQQIGYLRYGKSQSEYLLDTPGRPPLAISSDAPVGVATLALLQARIGDREWDRVTYSERPPTAGSVL